MTAEMLLRTAMLVLLGTVSVSLWTVRVALTARGRRLAASGTAGVEAVVFVLAFSSVLESLDSPVEVAGYAVGVAAGTMLGVVADTRLSTGQSAVRIIVRGAGDGLVTALRGRGWPATRLRAEGIHGEAALLLVVLDDARLSSLLADLRDVAPAAFWAVERLQSVKPAPLPPGYRQLRGWRAERVSV
jgi:uncharacterized protein YebE (UPF0316 family)